MGFTRWVVKGRYVLPEISYVARLADCGFDKAIRGVSLLKALHHRLHRLASPKSDIQLSYGCLKAVNGKW
jgi:hypothetical protein